MNETISSRIKQVRTTSGLNQRDFAKQIDVGASTQAMFETGDREPKPIHVNRICSEFNVNEDWLLYGIGEMSFKPKTNELIAKAAKLLGEHDPTFEAFVETYSRLNHTNRKIILEFGLDFLRCLQDSTKI